MGTLNTAYNRFLTSLNAGDAVIVYSTRDGASWSAVVDVADSDGVTVGAGDTYYNLGSIGNGRGRARGMKVLPASVHLPQGFVLTQAEAEELVE